MEEADSCRRAAFEAVADVEPPQLHDLVESVLANASMIPGVLTIESAARATTPPLENAADEADFESVEIDTEGIYTHAAGVQLIYEGLGLTRTLAHDEPWTATSSEPIAAEADLEILAADILVARGFYLLARTDAAGKAVRTVQSFGRDQTHLEDLRRDDGQKVDARPSQSDPAAIDANLERDVLELAVRAGAAAVEEPPSPRLLALADELAGDVAPSFPPVEECLNDFSFSPSDRSLEEPTTDRATSATDP
ncbi:hypothetical protein EA462_10700 [Natrarchaeobius halalkaliphilus]|uniref:Uncharacterized protein n=1 Tax=Natrarchaeobius halalkaliphilus TaxID=1679091 RepID=A0A3N6LZV9_9EURY|nr:hypothetical protein [Natrarchaeobius halalkaliphilus]RQG88860.1 hypothetical protein EA462_10700 [Natrarchaeobius halalkaliphilus]